MLKSGRSHIWVSDLQIRPGDVRDHLRWIGYYIADKRPDVIIIGGDLFDLPSLCSYDKGKKKSEGSRLNEDLEAGWSGLEALMKPWWVEGYNPQMEFQLGNHEFRLERHIESNAELSGLFHFPNTFRLDEYGWNVTPYLKYKEVDGVHFIHFPVNQFTGKPLGGMVSTQLKQIGFSFVSGHKQTLDMAIQPLGNGEMRRGIIQGACYITDADYIPPSANNCWRGILYLTEVKNGSYGLVEVSLDFLCRKYENMTIGAFLRKKYPKMFGTLWEKE